MHNLSVGGGCGRGWPSADHCAAKWTGPVALGGRGGVDLVTMGVMVVLVGFHWPSSPPS